MVERAFPWENESHWPKMIEVPVLRDVDVEVRKEAQIYVSTLQRNAFRGKVLQKAGASTQQLNLQLMQGLLRFGGRLVNAPLGDEKKSLHSWNPLEET